MVVLVYYSYVAYVALVRDLNCFSAFRLLSVALATVINFYLILPRVIFMTFKFSGAECQTLLPFHWHLMTLATRRKESASTVATCHICHSAFDASSEPLHSSMYVYVLSPSPAIDSIWAVMLVWKLRGKTIRTAPCCVVSDNDMHTAVSNS